MFNGQQLYCNCFLYFLHYLFFRMTADHDDRVVPSHTLKYVAELYYLLKDNNFQYKPILTRVCFFKFIFKYLIWTEVF